MFKPVIIPQSVTIVFSLLYTLFLFQPLKEYLLYLESIYEALERRDAIQIDYENSLDELNKLKIEKEQVTNSNPSTTQQSFGYWKPISGQDKLEQLNISITKSLNVVEVSL